MGQDRSVVLAVVLALAGVAVIAIGGTVYLLAVGRGVDVLAGIASTAVGALAALLARTSTSPPEQPDVKP